MSAKNTEIENKSLAPQVDDKAATPAAAKSTVPEGMVVIVVAHPLEAGKIGNPTPLSPGDEFAVPAHTAAYVQQCGAGIIKG